MKATKGATKAMLLEQFGKGARVFEDMEAAIVFWSELLDIDDDDAKRRILSDHNPYWQALENGEIIAHPYSTKEMLREYRTKLKKQRAERISAEQ